MGLSGDIEQVRLGETFHAMVTIAQFAADVTAGGKQEEGRRFGIDLIQPADLPVSIDWQVSFARSTIVRAHQHAAAAKGESQKPQLWDVARLASALK